ncbi:MAG: polyprenyl synthetase family protein [Candidatus Woesearchaeota archaeon]
MPKRMNEFEKTFESYRKKINTQLEKYLKEKIRKSRNVSEEVEEVIESLREFTLRGGKRIRPMLVISGYKACGGQNEKAIIEASVAVELMESFLLIHDDIIDKDDIRRGGPALHIQLSKLLEEKKNGEKKEVLSHATGLHVLHADKEHYGRSMGMLAGDIAAILGCDALLKSSFPAEQRLAAAEIFNSTVVDTCFGQILDINSASNININNIEISIKSIKKIHKMKTAIYTAYAPLLIGAVLADATPLQKSVLRNYAIPFGMAFQIQDDIIGLFGDALKIGKPAGSDFREGKITLLTLKAIENATRGEKKEILNALGRGWLKEYELERIKDIVIRTGSLEYSQKISRKLCKQAVAALDKTELDKSEVVFLKQLAEYIVNREK